MMVTVWWVGKSKDVRHTFGQLQRLARYLIALFVVSNRSFGLQLGQNTGSKYVFAETYRY
jgi:hypothetical protein